MAAPVISIAKREISYDVRTRTGTSIATHERLILDEPYHPDFVLGIKALGGKWSPSLKVWHCDLAAEMAVRELLLDVYGTDGTYAQPLVSVTAICVARPDQLPSDLWMLGKAIISKGRLGKDVTQRRTGAGGPYALTVYDVPAALAARAVDEPPEGWQISIIAGELPASAAVDLVAPILDRILPLSWEEKVAVVRHTLTWMTKHKTEQAPGGGLDDAIAELEAMLAEATR